MSKKSSKKQRVSIDSKLADYLDYLHMQKVKAQSSTRISLADVKKELGLAG